MNMYEVFWQSITATAEAWVVRRPFSWYGNAAYQLRSRELVFNHISTANLIEKLYEPTIR